VRRWNAALIYRDYSTRSARIGSIVAARRAGIKVAMSATVTATEATAAASPMMPDGGASPWSVAISARPVDSSQQWS
jgi:hypothetical protein